jgi:hypothetical protein
MKRLWLLTGFATLLATFPSFAQAPRVTRPGAAAAAPAAAAPTSQLMRIRTVKADSVVTPEVDVRIPGNPTQAGKQVWLRLRAEYDTSELWSDEVTVAAYALLKAKRKEDVGPTGKQLNLVKGEVTFVNVPKGKHVADLYLPPDTFTRYAGGDKSAVEKVAVIFTINGQVVGQLSEPADRERWWEGSAPIGLPLLNHAQTPFGLANPDDQHQIKPVTR